MNIVDNLLNKITMYRLMLYFLMVLVTASFILSFFAVLPFTPLTLTLFTLVLLIVGLLTNTLLARIFSTPTNLESVYITALILVLIVTPTSSRLDLVKVGAIVAIGMASKYIIAIKGKHLFNPAAFSVFLAFILLNFGASWWVGNIYLLPIVFLGGLLIVRKIRRFSQILSFLAVSFGSILLAVFLSGSELILTLQNFSLNSPIFFFAFIMLTEPLTSPPTQKLQILYGSLVGLLLFTQIPSGTFTPEAALLVGNVFSYIVSPKTKLVLKLKDKVQIGKETYSFVFTTNQRTDFKPGQYLEWTLGFPHPDSRGNRRYFTIASSPTETDLKLGVKFYPRASSFKKALFSLKDGVVIGASQLAGDFILPDDEDKKLVFIAGGIGVTPFRSMVKYLVDKGEKRDIVLFYSNNTQEEIVYQDIFKEAESFGVKTIYTLSDLKQVPAGWTGKTGFVTPEMIKEEVPDYKDRTFYISGPHGLVKTFEKVLAELGVSKLQIKTDFFPGYA